MLRAEVRDEPQSRPPASGSTPAAGPALLPRWGGRLRPPHPLLLESPEDAFEPVRLGHVAYGYGGQCQAGHHPTDLAHLLPPPTSPPDQDRRRQDDPEEDHEDGG